MPTSAATARAVAALSPVSSTGRSPSALSEATASAEVGFTVSATTRIARAAPSQPTATAVRPAASASARAASSSAGSGIDQSASSAGRPATTPWPSTAPSTPRPSRFAKPSTARERAELVARRRGDRAGDRVLGGVLERARQAQRLGAVGAVRGGDADELHAPGRDRAGLVEHDRVDAAGGLEHLGALDEQAELRAAPGADEQRGGRGEPERARAGDDQHRDGGAERERRGLARAEPEAERGDGEADDDRDEHAGDAVGEPLHGRLARLRLGHEPRDLGERGVGADLRRADDEPAAGVHRRARDGVARLLLDRARTRPSAATGRRPRCRTRRRRPWRPSRPGGRRSGRRPAAARPARGAPSPSSPRSATSLAPSSSSAVSAAPGAALGARLEVAAREQEHGDDGGDLEVELVGAALGEEVERHPHVRHAGVAEEQRVERPQPGGERAERDQRVHRRGAVAEVRPRRAVERPAAPQDDRRGELEREPLPVVELERGDHRQQQHGQREQRPRSRAGGAAAPSGPAPRPRRRPPAPRWGGRRRSRRPRRRRRAASGAVAPASKSTVAFSVA